MYRDDGNGWVYIILERLPGESLEKTWHTLGESDKALITGKLRSIFTQMRDLSSPGFYSDVCRRDLPNNLFWTKEKLPSISGPFQREHDLNMGLVKKLRMNAAGRKSRFNKADFYVRNLSRALRNHPPAFSHSDVPKKIILVREIPTKSPGQVKDFEVGVVDWEAAGWYHSYWEHVSLAMFFAWPWTYPGRGSLFSRKDLTN
jgi:hypothetical protein